MVNVRNIVFLANILNLWVLCLKTLCFCKNLHENPYFAKIRTKFRTHTDLISKIRLSGNADHPTIFFLFRNDPPTSLLLYSSTCVCHTHSLVLSEFRHSFDFLYQEFNHRTLFRVFMFVAHRIYARRNKKKPRPHAIKSYTGYF